MISVQSDLKIEVNAKEITLKSEGDLLLLQFPDWSAYKVFRKNLPSAIISKRNFLSNPVLISINGRDAVEINSRGGFNLKSIGLSLKMLMNELKTRLAA